MSATSKTKIPGYTGFVPSIKSENVHGSTYGKTTKSSQMGTVLKGMNQPAAERFKSTSQASYGTQPTEAMLFPFMDPIDGIVAPADDGGVPFGMHAKFHGVTPDDDDTFKKDAETFFGDGTKYHEKLAKQKEDISAASTKFYGMGARVEYDQDAYSAMPLSFAEAKMRAYGK